MSKDHGKPQFEPVRYGGMTLHPATQTARLLFLMPDSTEMKVTIPLADLRVLHNDLLRKLPREQDQAAPGSKTAQS
jgi:hypothetical protein